MVSETLTERTVVNRLRVRGLAAARVATALAAADLRPQGLSRAAVLCVRRLLAPQYVGTAPGVTSGWWESQLREALDQLARTAARPGLGPVPAGAEAVVFADRAELLACFARDWLAGAVAQRWWWEVLFRGRAAAGFARVCGDHLPYFPAALDHLAAWGLAPALMEALTPDEAAALLRELAATFAIEAVAASVTGGVLHAGVGPLTFPVANRSLNSPDENAAWREFEREGVARRVEAPWAGRIPEMHGARLTAAQECLLAVGLLLHRDAARVRSARFADAVARWRHELERGGTGLPSATEARSRPPSTTAGVAPTGQEAQPPVHPLARTQTVAEATAVPGVGLPTITSAPAEEPGAASSQEVSDAPRPGVRPASENSHAAVETELGGVFYLVNVLLGLELYGDFTRPRHRIASLPLWDCLELLARRLLVDPRPTDAVWRVLAELAGRDPGMSAGSGSELEGGAALPDAWLDELAASAERWMCEATALGDVDDLPGWLIRRRAVVEVSLARVDVRFRLDELPIELRLSGLDRDPGWVPAAGRAVAFHYD